MSSSTRQQLPVGQALTCDLSSLQQRQVTVIELIARLRPFRDVHDKVASIVTDFATAIVYNIHVMILMLVCVHVCVRVCVCVFTISSRGAPDLHSRECPLIGQFLPHDNIPMYKIQVERIIR